MEAVFINESGNQQKVNIKSFRELKRYVCSKFRKSPIEVVYLNDGRVLVLDEEGKMKDLAINHQATKICHEFEAIFPSDYIVGDVVIFECFEDFDALLL